MSKNRRFVGAIVVFSALTFGVPPAAAALVQGQGQDKKADKKADKVEKKADKADQKHDKKDDAKVAVVDRDGHVRVFREYRRSLPPGLAKRESLPPGLQKQLRERDQLPPGLHQRLIEVPAPWVARLPPVPAHYHRYFAVDDFIVIDTRTNRVIAIVRDVWR